MGVSLFPQSVLCCQVGHQRFWSRRPGWGLASARVTIFRVGPTSLKWSTNQGPSFPVLNFNASVKL